MRIELYALGAGSLVTEQLGLFGYGTKIRETAILRNQTRTEGDLTKDRTDVGASFRFAPTSMTWLKFGRTNELRSFERYFVPSEDATSANGRVIELQRSPGGIPGAAQHGPHADRSSCIWRGNGTGLAGGHTSSRAASSSRPTAISASDFSTTAK